MKGLIVLACAAGLFIGCGVEGDGAGEGSPGPGSGSAADEFFDRIDQAIDTQCDEEGYGLEMAGTPCPDFNLYASDCQDGERLVELYGDDGSFARGDYDYVEVGAAAPPGRTLRGKTCMAGDERRDRSRLYLLGPDNRLIQSRSADGIFLTVECKPLNGSLSLWLASRDAYSPDGVTYLGGCLFDPSLNRPHQE